MCPDVLKGLHDYCPTNSPGSKGKNLSIGFSAHLSMFTLPCIFCPASLIMCLSGKRTSRVEAEVPGEGCREVGVTCAKTHLILGVVTAEGPLSRQQDKVSHILNRNNSWGI